MSSNDHLDSGVSKPIADHTPGASASPQDSQPHTPAAELSSIPAGSENTLGPAASAVPAVQTQAGDAAAANHPAIGGESIAPVTAKTSTTAPSPDNTDATAQPQPVEIPPMDTEEPKLSAEVSSEDVPGKETEDAGPSLHITLLLTTGSRHPFTIDGKYLRKRSVNVDNNDPFAMSVYTLKELIWREWRSGKSIYWRCIIGRASNTNPIIDWETRPSSPSSIRLISFGKLLDDKCPLSGMDRDSTALTPSNQLYRLQVQPRRPERRSHDRQTPRGGRRGGC